MKKFALLVAIGLSAGVGYGFLPEDWPVANPAQGVKAPTTPATIRQPSSAQLQAAKGLPNAEIQWDWKTGAPLSVRADPLLTSNLGGRGLKVSGQGNYAQDAIAVLDNLSAVYAVQDAQQEFAVFRVQTDELGFHHARLNQLHRGLRVVGAQVIVHFNKTNQAYQVNGRYIPNIAVDNTPALKPEQAVELAQANLKARGKPEGTLQSNPELVVYAGEGEAKLAYELILTYSAASSLRSAMAKRGPGLIPGRWIYTVDALTGQILNAYNSIPAAAATITGNLLAGEGGASVSVTGTSDSGMYYLQSSLWLIHNYDSIGAYPDSNNDARRTTADWGASDTIEMSGAYNFSLIQNYFATVHNRNSYDNAGARAIVNVHVGSGSFLFLNNAYWDPDKQQFFFYDGDGYDLNGLTVADISAHEFTHAITEKTANLTYQDESGALNESFSDIFGALVEFYYQPDGRSAYPNKAPGAADWLVGEDVMVSDAALRDIRTPSRYSQPSRYYGTSWYLGSEDNGGVHVNSGVQNFFFYLLCEGGSGDNDGTSYGVTGIGFTNAARVAFRALTVYCPAHTDHSAVRTAWISAATDIDSNLVSSVQAAWDAVGVSEGVVQPTARYTPLIFDYDGDRFGDPTLYDTATGYWYVRLSSANYAQVSGLWGGSGYKPLAGFFDNDSSYDPTIYDTSSGNWYMLLSTYGFYSYMDLNWGGGESYVPVCGDSDGDRLGDPTLYEPSTGSWSILASSHYWANFYTDDFSPGPADALPFMGDFDGDHKEELTFYSPATGYWYIALSTMYWLTYFPFWFSVSGATATVGDLDGDLLADLILRSSEGIWYVLLSSSGYQSVITFSW